MGKIILLTGATDGIGLETAKMLAGEGHTLLLHGRSQPKLDAAASAVAAVQGSDTVRTLSADLGDLSAVARLASDVAATEARLDVLINNAGVFKLPGATTVGGLDLRFVVNTLAPYVLTHRLLPAIPSTGRIINLSSAAQAPVSIDALCGRATLDDNAAYAQSKLAITMWSRFLADELGPDGPAVIAVNPASFLGSKMVEEAYGVAGEPLWIGADVLVRAALSDEFANASGQYYDNDRKRFGAPHPDAMDAQKNAALVDVLHELLAAQGIAASP